MGQPLNKKDFKNLLAAASSNMEWALDAAKTLPMTGRMWRCDLKTGRRKGQEPNGQCARRFSGHGHGPRGQGEGGAARVERQPAVGQRAASCPRPSSATSRPTRSTCTPCALKTASPLKTAR